MTPRKYFSSPQSIPQKQYDALKSYFGDGQTAEAVAKAFGYTYRGFTTIISDFRKRLLQYPEEDPFLTRGLKVGRRSFRWGKTGN